MKQGGQQWMPHTVEKSAEGMVDWMAPVEGPNDGGRRTRAMIDGTVSENRVTLDATCSRDDPVGGEPDAPESIPKNALLERVMERSNLQRALKQVRQNKGAPGIDGMTVDELPEHLKVHWLELRERLMAGTYHPQPVRRVQIPKPDGRVRLLGIPTVLDRFIQQAIAQCCTGAMGCAFSSAQLGISPAMLGPPRGASVAGGYPGRARVGG
ncbi:MAG: hypothetical protein IPJ33_16330 [Gammaproteobacteria bacterium]|jgi:hypothetical protein|nr:hypothetical protein [Gammaproteobacteria bacterium]MBK7519254.1 hypothetical protein [Gammaproteobacteria bacterium]MBK7730008.1 hypothetical protein [Gammaproteobacteria bacterium]MBP6053916.1 hypothetical protein [Pseudomonadales bacterium]MBP6229722.1 hypothetical protein [Pseudomonadales bacterium]